MILVAQPSLPYSPDSACIYPLNPKSPPLLVPEIPLVMETIRVDRVPLVLTMLMEMGVPNSIDLYYQPHGNRKGLSVGWLLTIFLAYILSEADHRLVPVQEWVAKRGRVLERMIGQSIGEHDFSDDRLADALRYLNDDGLWWAIENDLSHRSVQVYDLEVAQSIRLDATVGKAYHQGKKQKLFRKGRNKAGQYEVQFKLMLGVLDPLSFPLASDVVAGSAADDPLYLPTYQRIRQTLGRVGLLYIGDCKMAALITRATMAIGHDYYLTPLPQTGETPTVIVHPPGG